MSENKDLTSSVSNQISTAANDAVFSRDTNNAVNNVISIAEARREFAHIGSNSLGVIAYAQHLCGLIGIEFGGSQAQKAAKLVQLRTMVATNNPSSEEPKKAA